MARTTHSLLLLAIGWPALAQVPYPDHVIQGISWSNGTHYSAVSQPITAPALAGLSVSVSGTADVEFVSGAQVRLRPGFHAGGFEGGGRFRAHIDPALGTPPDLVVIAPDPATHVQDGVLHVNKWEKLEIGLRLPQDHQDAIDRFFEHYYSNGTGQTATPGQVDALHDLNPYADDSLQLVMTLVDPNGQHRVKWGFFMREAKWVADVNPLTPLGPNPAHPLDPYHIRFRFAPDEEGLWQFALSLKAPHTRTLLDQSVANVDYTGLAFVCDASLPDNHGHLEVNAVNQRVLQFEDGNPFFGLGVNMADKRYKSPTNGLSLYRLVKRDFEFMKETMRELNSVGGNFMRMFLMRHLFSPEWVNVGVYDDYLQDGPCDGEAGMQIPGNCQFQCWAFDQMLETARSNSIYIQLCIDPYPPIINYETYIWGNHPYVKHYLDNERDQETGRFDLKAFFYEEGDPLRKDHGVFYYWKRKYKYIMARWGYSVNIAAIEPFNEIDQMLTYQDNDLVPPDPEPPGYQPPALCPENKLHWPADPQLPNILDAWVSDITSFVRDPVDHNDPATSPLGEVNKLFLMSYTDAKPPVVPGTGQPNSAYFKPFENPAVDIIDVHRGVYAQMHEVSNNFDMFQLFRENYLSNGHKKPFHNGEYATGGWVNDVEGNDRSTWDIFDNYDISFHNELWSTAFFGSFAAGTTWYWERVFWWPFSLDPPPGDLANMFQQVFSSDKGATNHLDLGQGVYFPIVNRPVHHHFKPLSDLLTRPNWQALDFFNGEHSPHKVYDQQGGIECYYLVNEAQDIAIGWVHNLNAYWFNKFYLTKADQHFLGCVTPNAQTVALPGFVPGTDYYISYFPTRMNTEVCPVDGFDDTGTGTVTLDLSSEPFNGILNGYIDTLHSDYAFIIAPFDVKSMPGNPKRMLVGNSEQEREVGWDFSLFPNPADEELFIRLPDDRPWDVEILDMMGRRVMARTKAAGRIQHLSIQGLPQGMYGVRVSHDTERRTKKLIIR